MGIFGALNTAVSGLSAQSYALENISGNIANSDTTGFKRVETSFVDLIPDGSANREHSGSVAGYSRSTNTVQGQLNATSVNTHMAINGDGYFIVQQSTGTTDNQPVLTDENYYTRRGDFELDRNGYLVNGSGSYLTGQKLDPATGNPTGSQPEAIRITSDVLPAQQSTSVNYRASLPESPSTSEAVESVPGSELMQSSLIGQATIGAADSDNFIATSVSGGSVTLYDAKGAEANVQLRWAKTANETTSTSDTWSLYYQSNSTTGSEQWTRIGGDFTFDSTGKLTSPTSNPTISGLTVDGNNVGDVTFDIGSSGISQYARSSGDVEVTMMDQNGYPAGRMSDISITDTGRVRANYSNGRSVDLYEVPIATFNGDSKLKRMDGGLFAETSGSGAPLINGSASIVAGSVEGSNVDISEEFTKLIVTQQAYSANTKIVTTANQMLQETINMIR